MAVFIGATGKKLIYRRGKPYKDGNVWGQEIMEITENGEKIYSVVYAYKKGTLSRELKKYPLWYKDYDFSLKSKRKQ